MDRRKVDEQKEVMKEVLQEWLDKQFAVFGKWTAKGLLSMVFFVVMYYWLSAHGINIRDIAELTRTATPQ